MRPSAFVLLVTISLAACSVQTQVVRESDEAAVRDTLAALAGRFSRAYEAGDAAAMAALYTDDAVLLPNRATEVVGREAIEAYWALPDGERITAHAITPLAIEVDGDVATDYGTYTVSGEANGEAWGPGLGNYLIVWRRGADGRWRMHLDMWNARPSPDTTPDG